MFANEKIRCKNCIGFPALNIKLSAKIGSASGGKKVKVGCLICFGQVRAISLSLSLSLSLQLGHFSAPQNFDL